MQFSVLMSTYYKEDPIHLEQALKSIWDYQVLKPNEIVFVKDGLLTDNLNNIINDFSKKAPLKVIQLNKNRGLGIALNEGLLHCSYDIVARMDSDDISKPYRFEKEITFLKNHPEIDIIGSCVDEFIGDTNNIISIREVPEKNEDIVNYAKSRNPLNHPSVIFRKQAAINAGGYKPFSLFEDYYLWVRMILNECKFHNLQESLLFFRTSDETYKRRGGWKYVKTEIKLQNTFIKLKFITPLTYIQNVFIRSTIRLVPNCIRTYIYTIFLHHNNNKVKRIKEFPLPQTFVIGEKALQR